MRCDEILPLLQLRMDGELPDELEVATNRHLLKCTYCAHEAHSLEQSRRMLRSAIEVAQPSDAFLERLAVRLNERFSESPSTVPRLARGHQRTLW